VIARLVSQGWLDLNRYGAMADAINDLPRTPSIKQFFNPERNKIILPASPSPFVPPSGKRMEAKVARVCFLPRDVLLKK